MNLKNLILVWVLVLSWSRYAGATALITPWPVAGLDDSAAVGAARLSGVYAVGDSFENNVEIRDIRQKILRTISSAEMRTLLPWMSFDGGPDGPSAIAVSDSGRQVFISVHDDTVPGDGGPSDGILLYDSYDDLLRLFARLNLFNRGDEFPHLASKHFAGRLYVGTYSEGIKVFRAGISDNVGSLLETASLPGGSPVRGLAIDPDQNLLFAAGTNMLYRASLAVSPLSLVPIGSIADIRSCAFSVNYGGTNSSGLYVLAGRTTATLFHIPAQQARGTQSYSPAVYVTALGVALDIAATACGRLLVGADEDALMISDDSDSLLSFDRWLNDEFDQVIKFCKTLVAADGHGAGWTTDADVAEGRSRFHPCSPDGAGWVILALLLADEIRGDRDSQVLVRDILVRYAGQAADGIRPQRTADGIYRHWYDPNTGGTFGSWDPEFATLSTMKIVLAAARARKYYWANPVIRAAASTIIDGLRNRSAYIRNDTAGIYFRGLQAGGPDPNSIGLPFQEGILFVEQLAAFEDSVNPLYKRWLDRSQWPTAELVPGKGVTVSSSGSFQPAFVSLYPWLLQRDFRDSASWERSLDNLWSSQAAWTDSNGTRYYTVFSAGTAPSGYTADSLTSHLENITTFPSLMAFSSKGSTLPAVAGYQGYRRGARQRFAGGASILYRRNASSWEPDSAGLPDVVLGAIGLAELIRPGVVDKILALDMSGNGVRLTPQSALLELSWPQIGGWRIQESTNLTQWTEHLEWPNPCPVNPGSPTRFFRAIR